MLTPQESEMSRKMLVRGPSTKMQFRTHSTHFEWTMALKPPNSLLNMGDMSTLRSGATSKRMSTGSGSEQGHCTFQSRLKRR